MLPRTLLYKRDAPWICTQSAPAAAFVRIPILEVEPADAQSKLPRTGCRGMVWELEGKAEEDCVDRPHNTDRCTLLGILLFRDYRDQHMRGTLF